MACCGISKNPYYATSKTEMRVMKALMASGVAVSSLLAAAGIFGILGATGVLPQSVSFLGIVAHKGMEYAILATVAGVALVGVTSVVTHRYWPVYNPVYLKTEN